METYDAVVEYVQSDEVQKRDFRSINVSSVTSFVAPGGAVLGA